MTKKMLERALHSGSTSASNNLNQTYSYDAHADWEVSSLLSALDERSRAMTKTDGAGLRGEIAELAETCASILESQTGSAEVFIQLAERAIRGQDYKKLDRLSDRLAERFSAGEVAEIVRQTEMPQIRAIAYETLALMPVQMVVPLLDDPLYAEIAANALEQKAFEYESEEAREILERFENDFRTE
jgi:hypothetical protein